jgi:hypothetical protein
MDEPDTIRESDLILKRVESLSGWDVPFESKLLTNYKEQLEFYSLRSKGPYGYIFKDSYEEYNRLFLEQSEICKKIQLEIKENKSLYDEMVNTTKDSILFIIYNCHFRISNSFGGLVKTMATIVYHPYEKDEDKWSVVIDDESFKKSNLSILSTTEVRTLLLNLYSEIREIEKKDKRQISK